MSRRKWDPDRYSNSDPVKDRLILALIISVIAGIVYGIKELIEWLK